LFTVALIGPDGSGKTTVSRQLESELGLPVKLIYMGVNRYAGDVMLPHTRLILALSRSRRGDDPEAASDLPTYKPPPATVPRRVAASLRSGLWLISWLAEESYRLAVARRHTRRGEIVIFDRHFFADFFATDIGAVDGPRPLGRRIHGFVLKRVFPRPDLMVCLDAPAEVLYARKPEGSIERISQKREEYLAVLEALPETVIVDAGMPADEVLEEVLTTIRSFYDRRLRDRRSRRPLLARALGPLRGGRS
jgi:thymidylate kinase